MQVRRKKNGFLITVAKWSSDVVVTRLSDGEKVVTTFSDHFTAVQAAKTV